MSGDDQLAPAIAAFQRGDLDGARRIAERAAAGNATAAPAEHLLGLIHCRLGDFERGVDHLSRAIAADPANSAYRVMLARALVDSARPAEVLQMPEPAREGGSESRAAWAVRAEAAQAVGDWPAAADAWHFLARAAPADWRAQASLGNALGACGRWGEAAAALGRSVELNPSDAALRSSLALALERFGESDAALGELYAAVALTRNSAPVLALAQMLGRMERFDQALDILERDQALLSENSELRLERGRTLVALMRFDEAEDAYRQLLAGDPGNRAALRELGLILERTGRIDAVRQLLPAAGEAGADEFGYLRALVALQDGEGKRALELLQCEPSTIDPVRWHRLMARIAEALGDPHLAFASAQAMNRAVPGFDEWRARGAAYRRRTRELARRITPDWVDRIPRLEACQRRTPAFLVGFPRSGTTLLDTFLMGHPATWVLEEVQMLNAAERVIGNVSNLAEADAAALERARGAYFDEMDRHVDPGFAGVVIDKLPLNMLGLPLIAALFPDARIIFAQRHPCDVVLSGFMQSFVLNDGMACFLDIEDAADLYDAAMEVWSRSRALVDLPLQPLRFEDLVAQPEAALRPVIDLLGLEWRPELLDHQSTAKRRGAILTPSYDQVIRPLSKRPVGRWRRFESQLEAVLPVLLPWAERLGYGD